MTPCESGCLTLTILFTCFLSEPAIWSRLSWRRLQWLITLRCCCKWCHRWCLLAACVLNLIPSFQSQAELAAVMVANRAAIVPLVPKALADLPAQQEAAAHRDACAAFVRDYHMVRLAM